MRTIDTVLVPLDGSEFSRTAVPAATRLATRLDAAIHLLSAVESVDKAGNREADLAHVAVPGRRVRRTVVVDRDPARAIHETLRRMPAGVACMATHGRGRSTALIGSVATDVVARGHDVVLVCPYIDQARRTADVVVCVDDSSASAGLVMVGLDWADRLGERLVVLTVAEEVQPPATDEPPQRRFGPDGDVERFLEELVRPARAVRRTVDTAALYNPTGVWQGLYRHLSEAPATLLVVNSRVRPPPVRLVFGSVATTIVRHSHVPVLVVRRPDDHATR
jgi:nucleotide-binding universal stress UspA family protein